MLDPVLLLAVSLAAPPFQGASFEEDPLEILLPLDADATVLRCLEADVTGDGVVDLVVHAPGSEPSAFLVYGPAHYAHPSGGVVIPLEEGPGASEPVTGLALFPNATAFHAAGILSLAEGRLVRWRWDPQLGAFERTELAGPWSDPQHIALWDVGAPTFTLGVVTEADGNLRSLVFQQESGALFSVMAPVALGSEPIEAVELLDWDADQQAEVYLQREDHGEIRELDGTLVRSWLRQDWPGAGHALRAGGAFDRIVWAEKPAFLPETLLSVLGAFGDETGVPVGALAQALAVGDHDQDGVLDALLAVPGSDPFLLYLGQGSGPLYSNAFRSSVVAPTQDPALLPAGTVPALVLADFDHDGDDDVLALDPAGGRALLHRGALVDAAYWHPEEASVQIVHCCDETDFRLQGFVSVPHPHPDATRLEIVLWPGIPGETHAGPPIRVECDLPLGGSVPFSVGLDCPPPFSDGPTSWSIEMRQYRPLGATARLALPARTGWLRFNLQGALTAGSGGPTAVPQSGPGPGRGPGGPTYALGGGTLRGDFIPLGDIPPFCEDEDPIFPVMPPP